VKIKLYIEGGGDSRLQDSLFRKGWSEFFRKAGLAGRMPSTFRGGSRSKTFDAFQIAVRTKKVDELPLLLVDSESLVAAGITEWEHLKAHDGWDKPNAAGDEDAYLMICVMETWFLADLEATQTFFRNCWRDKAVPQWANLEEVAKTDIMRALEQATTDCGKKQYAKGKLSFEILGVIDPAVVENHCPSAKRLLDRLRG